RWPATEDAKKFSTVAGDSYFDAPTNWRPDSVWKLKINGVRYGEEPDGSPMVFTDFLNWKEDYPNSTDKKWSVQWLRVHVSPEFAADGENNGCIWGFKTVDSMSANGDTTIFSYNMPECNDAIV